MHIGYADIIYLCNVKLEMYANGITILSFIRLFFQAESTFPHKTYFPTQKLLSVNISG